MPLSLTLGNRRLVASWWFVLLAGVAVLLFVGLGRWQWQRGDYRSRVWAEFNQGGTAPLAGSTDLHTLPRFARVAVQGSLDADHQFLLDNMPRAGRPGYEVLTPLLLADGSALLVNRGWLPFSGYRDRLPDLAFDSAGPVTLTGRIEQLPTPGLASGRAPPPATGPWPRVTSYPTAAELSAALGRRIDARVLLLDAASGPGYQRDWQPPGVSPDRNYSYAVQWWFFAAVALGLFTFLNLEKRR